MSLGNRTRLQAAIAKGKAKRTFESPPNPVFLYPAAALTHTKTSSRRFRTLMLSA